MFVIFIFILLKVLFYNYHHSPLLYVGTMIDSSRFGLNTNVSDFTLTREQMNGSIFYVNV